MSPGIHIELLKPHEREVIGVVFDIVDMSNGSLMLRRPPICVVTRRELNTAVCGISKVPTRRIGGRGARKRLDSLPEGIAGVDVTAGAEDGCCGGGVLGRAVCGHGGRHGNGTAPQPLPEGSV